MPAEHEPASIAADMGQIVARGFGREEKRARKGEHPKEDWQESLHATAHCAGAAMSARVTWEAFSGKSSRRMVKGGVPSG